MQAGDADTERGIALTYSVPSLVLFLVLLFQIETQFLEARNRFLRLLTEARPRDHDYEPGVALDQDLCAPSVLHHPLERPQLLQGEPVTGQTTAE